MSSNILQSLMSHLGDNELDMISKQVGIDKSQAANALQGIMPTLLGAMANNTANSGGASALMGALDKDHDGSILDNVAGFLQGPDTGMGSGILKHLLGSNQSAVESNIGKQSGLSSGAVSQLFKIAAPLVMGYLGKQKQSQGISAGGIGSLLQGLAGQADTSSSFDMGDIFGMLAGGSSKGGMGGIAGKLLGGLLGGK